MTPSSLTCIHAARGLCPDCEDERAADPSAWEEFGRHTEGERRWQELRAELLADLPPVRLADDAGLPF